METADPLAVLRRATQAARSAGNISCGEQGPYQSRLKDRLSRRNRPNVKAAPYLQVTYLCHQGRLSVGPLWITVRTWHVGPGVVPILFWIECQTSHKERIPAGKKFFTLSTSPAVTCRARTRNTARATTSGSL
jgi:hypothetical protein